MSMYQECSACHRVDCICPADLDPEDFDECPHCGREVYFTAFDKHVKACAELREVLGEEIKWNPTKS